MDPVIPPIDAGGPDLTTILASNKAGVPAGTVKVYMGQKSSGMADGMDGPKGPVDYSMSADTAKAYYGMLQPSEQKSIGNKLYQAGLIHDPGDYDSVVAAWNSAVDYAGLIYTGSGRRITPWDVLQSRIGLADASLKKTAAAAKQPTTVTSSAVQVLTDGTANTMIKAMYQNELGRDPTAGELSRYRSMLINKSESSPQVTTTTKKFLKNPDGTQGAEISGAGSSVTTGGFGADDANDILQQKTQADPEYGAYQAATTYMGALENLMGGQPNLAAGGA
jgi:hypothetical protein